MLGLICWRSCRYDSQTQLMTAQNNGQRVIVNQTVFCHQSQGLPLIIHTDEKRFLRAIFLATWWPVKCVSASPRKAKIVNLTSTRHFPTRGDRIQPVASCDNDVFAKKKTTSTFCRFRGIKKRSSHCLN